MEHDDDSGGEPCPPHESPDHTTTPPPMQRLVQPRCHRVPVRIRSGAVTGFNSPLVTGRTSPPPRSRGRQDLHCGSEWDLVSSDVTSARRVEQFA